MKNFDQTNFLLDYLDIDWNNSLELDKNDPSLSMKIFSNKMDTLPDKHMTLKKCQKMSTKGVLSPGSQMKFS